MILIRRNVEIHTDNEGEIKELKRDGFREVKVNDGKPARKRSRKAAKPDSK